METPTAPSNLSAHGSAAASSPSASTSPIENNNHRAVGLLLPSPVRSPQSRLRLASSSSSGGIGGVVGGGPGTSSDNFARYGSIRPPVSVVQDEFLDVYRSWREHAESLDGIDTDIDIDIDDYYYCVHPGMVGGDENNQQQQGVASSSWAGHMARIRKLHYRYHPTTTTSSSSARSSGGDRDYDDDDGGGGVGSGGGGSSNADLFEPWSSSGLFPNVVAANDDVDRCCRERKCQKKDDEGKVAVSDEDEDEESLEECDNDVVRRAPSSAGDEYERREELEGIASLIFRQGARLTGYIEFQQEACRSDYELVVMEGDAWDELGRPRGALARHTIAGDRQCVYVKLGIVSVVEGRSARVEDVLGSVQDEGTSSREEYATGENDDGIDGDNRSNVLSEEKHTIQIEYVDGDNSIRGLWNHDRLCFTGTVKKLTEGQGDRHQLGGTIIGGLVSGHRRANNESSRPSGEGNNPRKPTFASGIRTFSLSPSTHLHPRGVFPAPSWPTLSEALSRMVLISQADTTIRIDDVDQDPGSIHPIQSKCEVYTSETRRALLDEIASPDNYKLVLHRSRTDTLRRETLKKLVELGSIIDFSELARKRNVAKRREKWRGRVRKYTPGGLRRILRRDSRTSRKTGGEDYSLAKDDLRKKKVQFYDLLAAISWGDLLVEASIQSEETCANFRRQTALLDNLTFESDEYKAQVMADLRSNGMTVAASHFDWDQCIQMGRAVALGWSWFERGSWNCFERSAVVGKRCVYLLFMMHSRLETNHKHLEKAFRDADSRLTDMQLRRIKEGSCAAFALLKAKECEEAGVCGVCQCDMDEEIDKNGDANPAVCLPCSHVFHWDCVKQWLHDHSSCPSCRFDLTEKAKENDSVEGVQTQ